MGFEKWLELRNEVISDTRSTTVDELYAEYVYEENRTLSDCIFLTEEAMDYTDSWFN